MIGPSPTETSAPLAESLAPGSTIHPTPVTEAAGAAGTRTALARPRTAPSAARCCGEPRASDAGVGRERMPQPLPAGRPGSCRPSGAGHSNEPRAPKPSPESGYLREALAGAMQVLAFDGPRPLPHPTPCRPPRIRAARPSASRPSSRTACSTRRPSRSTTTWPSSRRPSPTPRSPASAWSTAAGSGSKPTSASTPRKLLVACPFAPTRFSPTSRSWCPTPRSTGGFATTPWSPASRSSAPTPGCRSWCPAASRLGTLCVIDRAPRDFSVRQLDMLRIIARQVVAHFRMRRYADEMEAVAAENQQLMADLLRAESRTLNGGERGPRRTRRVSRPGTRPPILGASGPIRALGFPLPAPKGADPPDGDMARFTLANDQGAAGCRVCAGGGPGFDISMAFQPIVNTAAGHGVRPGGAGARAGRRVRGLGARPGHPQEPLPLRPGHAGLRHPARRAAGRDLRAQHQLHAQRRLPARALPPHHGRGRRAVRLPATPRRLRVHRVRAGRRPRGTSSGSSTTTSPRASRPPSTTSGPATRASRCSRTTCRTS